MKPSGLITLNRIKRNISIKVSIIKEAAPKWVEGIMLRVAITTLNNNTDRTTAIIINSTEEVMDHSTNKPIKDILNITKTLVITHSTHKMEVTGTKEGIRTVGVQQIITNLNIPNNTIHKEAMVIIEEDIHNNNILLDNKIITIRVSTSSTNKLGRLSKELVLIT
jgi:hypothetical protein